ncbi:class I SAM-dependent methyltransferase [Actinoplanes sp. NPDC051411]|uniref:class I SAM-dependent methyltransferase n=1 Tax=Actinoplanes sp. NPDC051411 TaxID=3155522 RepID=UPI00341B0E47
MPFDPEGSAPLSHLSLLAHHPERLLALRLALARHAPGATVLDAGCGALGTLAIMAAKLGAARVVGVDGGPLPMARQLAEENGVGDRVTFLECDLDEADAAVGPFDVIIGMVYLNHPRLDLARQQLMARVAKRFAHATTVFVPDRVRLSVAGFDTRTADATGETKSTAWRETIERAESLSGLSMRAARFLVDPDWRKSRLGLAVPPLSPDARLTARFGFPDRNTMTQLTDREFVAEAAYAQGAPQPSYPENLEVPVTRAGRLDGVIWRQDIVAGDLLIRSTETFQAVDAAEPVIPRETLTLTLDDRWQRNVPATVTPG